MTLKALALSSASILVLTIGTAFAAGDDPYTHNSTPAEQQQTQQLNTQAQDQAVTQDAQGDADAANQAQTQQQYQDSQAQYQQSQTQYQADLQYYRDQRAEYNYDRRHPETWWHSRYERASLQHFYDIPRAELVDLRVIRDNGYRIGLIRDIDRADDGRVVRVKIALRNGDSAWVPARDLRYDPENHLVFTDLSVKDIYAMGGNS
jgi:hypothetical protein